MDQGIETVEVWIELRDRRFRGHAQILVRRSFWDFGPPRTDRDSTIGAGVAWLRSLMHGGRPGMVTEMSVDDVVEHYCFRYLVAKRTQVPGTVPYVPEFDVFSFNVTETGAAALIEYFENTRVAPPTYDAKNLDGGHNCVNVCASALKAGGIADGSFNLPEDDMSPPRLHDELKALVTRTSGQGPIKKRLIPPRIE